VIEAAGIETKSSFPFVRIITVPVGLILKSVPVFRLAILPPSYFTANPSFSAAKLATLSDRHSTTATSLNFIFFLL